MSRTLVIAMAALLTAMGASADWQDPDGDGYTEHSCDGTLGYCPASTPVLACHADGHRPQYRNTTPCLTDGGKVAGHGDTCTCDHPDGCYSDCLPEPPRPPDSPGSGSPDGPDDDEGTDDEGTDDEGADVNQRDRLLLLLQRRDTA